MSKIYKAIKNEAYPFIMMFIIISFLIIVFFVQLFSNSLYLIPLVVLIIIDTAIALNFYGVVFAYIKIDNEGIEYFYKQNKINIKWNDILNIRNAYPNKKVFAKRRELYEIQVITITSINNKDILFHYIVGSCIESIKKINVPYINDPSLSKGIWLSLRDSTNIITILKSKLPSNTIKIMKT